MRWRPGPQLPFRRREQDQCRDRVYGSWRIDKASWRYLAIFRLVGDSARGSLFQGDPEISRNREAAPFWSALLATRSDQSRGQNVSLSPKTLLSGRIASGER